MSDYYDKCQFYAASCHYSSPNHYDPNCVYYDPYRMDQHYPDCYPYYPEPTPVPPRDGTPLSEEDSHRDSDIQSESGDETVGEEPELQAAVSKSVNRPQRSKSQSKLPQQISINLINPLRKREGTQKKLSNVPVGTVSDLKEYVCSTLKVQDEERADFELGYYERGHGSKGKKRWLIDDDDLEDMKKHFEGKKAEILLWCYDPSVACSRKRSRGDSDPGPSAQKTSKSRSRFANAYEKKMTKVQEIFESLKEKHGDKFKPEQLNAWANMVQMQKHTSLDDPPPGRFFMTQRKAKEVEQEATAMLTPKSPPQPAELSPAKRVNLRTQCLEQLKGWHDLMQKGGISKEQYEELQADILSEVKTY